MVIDACAAPEKYLALLEQEHASLAAILQTHGHFDHVGSIPALKRATGARDVYKRQGGDQRQGVNRPSKW